MRVRIEFDDLALDNFSADEAQELVAIMLTEGVMPNALRAGAVEITAWKPMPDEERLTDSNHISKGQL